jgi:hypothetical protein
VLLMPKSPVSEVARRNLERFRATPAALELESDPKTWTVVEWPWTEGPPMRIHLRADDGTWMEFVMEKSGVWRMTALPIVEKIRVPGDLVATPAPASSTSRGGWFR